MALALVPEVTVLAAGVALLFAEALGRRYRRWLPWLGLAVAAVAFALELWLGAQVTSLFAGGWLQDRFALFAKLAVLIALVVLLATAAIDAEPDTASMALAFLATFGAMVAASAGTLIQLWAGIELAAFAGVAAIGLRDREAGLRLLVLSALAGAFIAAGLAFIYAFAGISALAGLSGAFLARPVTMPLALALLVLLAGLATRLGLAPFEFVSRQASAAASPLAAGVFGGLAVGAAAIASARLLAALAGGSAAWAPWLAAVAAFAIAVGSLRAFGAGSVRPAVAWLALVQLGWVAAGLAVHDRRGSAAAMFLLGAFLVTVAGAPAIASGLGQSWSGVSGMARRQPARALALSMTLLSLAGAPPLAGFFGEFTVAVELLQAGLGWLLGVGLVGSALTLAVAVRAVRLAYLEAEAEEPRRAARAQAWPPGPVLVALLVTAYGLLANPLHTLAYQGAEALGLR